jgi:hypothetical protein
MDDLMLRLKRELAQLDGPHRCHGPAVESVVALFEVADDALAVLDGVVVVVFELGVHL